MALSSDCDDDDASPASASFSVDGSPKLVPKKETFVQLQQAYLEMKREALSNNNNGSPLHDADDDFLLRLKEMLRSHQYYSAFTVPVEVRQTSGTPERGRGLFAMEKIVKDTVVRRSAHATFYHQTDWECFLAKLPVQLQSDAHVWAYVMEWDKSDTFALALDLDEGSLMNHAPTINENSSTSGPGPASSLTANVYFAKDTDGEWCEHASRDIQAGEEILCDYKTFISFEHSLDWYTYQHPV